MIKSVVTSFRRPVSLMVFASLMILVFALAACGDSGASSGGNSGGSNANSGGSGGGMTVNVKESKAGNGPDVYSCDPATITVKKGDKVTFTNQSDEKQDFDQGDAQKAGVDFVMDLNQSTSATFNTVGTFTIKSEKGATITVTVQ